MLNILLLRLIQILAVLPHLLFKVQTRSTRTSEALPLCSSDEEVFVSEIALAECSISVGYMLTVNCQYSNENCFIDRILLFDMCVDKLFLLFIY